LVMMAILISQKFEAVKAVSEPLGKVVTIHPFLQSICNKYFYKKRHTDYGDVRSGAFHYRMRTVK
jgi:hypothetical protein